MKLNYRPFLLEFKHPFGVSSNTRTETPTVFIKLESGDHTGYGEACLPKYLGETLEDTMAFFDRAARVLSAFSGKEMIEEIIKQIDALSPENNAAKAAIDIALHDLYGKKEGKPCYELLGLKKSPPLATSFTIGIDTEEKTGEKIKGAADFSILKIKAGTTDDKSLIRMVRRFTDKPLYVDVNQGWRDKEQALDLICWMQNQGVVLVEQPMPVGMEADMAWLTARSPLLTIADESVKRLEDLKRIGDSFSGINIKLMKCTGLSEALEMIGYARTRGLNILLGCMAESSCATTAMAHLAGQADFIDLDAPLLYKNDPFRGLRYQDGRIHLPERPGTGAELVGPELVV